MDSEGFIRVLESTVTEILLEVELKCHRKQVQEGIISDALQIQ
jgi:hypothetical protein